MKFNQTQKSKVVFVYFFYFIFLEAIINSFSVIQFSSVASHIWSRTCVRTLSVWSGSRFRNEIDQFNQTRSARLHQRGASESRLSSEDDIISDAVRPRARARNDIHHCNESLRERTGSDERRRSPPARISHLPL